MRAWTILALLAGLTVATAPARAGWLRAETLHFVVYSNDKDASVAKLATELETFDTVLRRFHRAAEQDGAGSNKLTVYVVDDIATVQRMCGKCAGVAGFYSGRASGSVAFTPRYTGSESPADLNARTVLFHEYAHHFLFGNYAMAYPAWFSEGYAEFASTFRRDKLGWTIGAAATHRAYSLFSGTKMSATRLFDPGFGKLDGEQREYIYGRGWLLTHYIMFDADRRAAFAKYLNALNSGTPSVAAATAAFGDLTKLDRALDGYLNARTIAALTIKPEALAPPKVDLRALSPGEAAMIGARMASTRGVDDKTAKPLYARARPVGVRFADDPVVQGWLAEMAFDADDLDAADAAADRALAKDAKSAQALLYKGMIGLRRAEQAKDAPGAAWSAARQYVINANQRDPDSALPLFIFYQSFLQQGRTPTGNAIAGLYRAQELAPQDDALRFAAMTQAVHDGLLDRARQLLKPLVYSAHGGGDEAVGKLLAALDAAKDKPAAEAALASFTSAAAQPAPDKQR